MVTPLNTSTPATTQSAGANAAQQAAPAQAPAQGTPTLTVSKSSGSSGGTAAAGGTDANGVAVPQARSTAAAAAATADLTTNEDTAATTGSVLAASTDSVSGYDSTSANGGTVAYNGNGTFTYTPSANYNGSDSFSYTVTDKDGNKTTTSMSISVAAVNDNPTAVGESEGTVEDNSITLNVLANDTDVDGDDLTVGSFDRTTANGGKVSKNSDGTLTYTPAKDFQGDDSFEYTVDDGNGGTSTATANVYVEPFSVIQSRLGKFDVQAALQAALASISSVKSNLAQAQLALINAGDEDDPSQVQVQITAGEAHMSNSPALADVKDGNTVVHDDLDPVEQSKLLTTEKLVVSEDVLEAFQEHLDRLADSAKQVQNDAQFHREELREEQVVEIDQKRLEKLALDFVASMLEVNGLQTETPVFNNEDANRALSESGLF